LPPGITTLPVTMTTVDVPSMTLPTLPGFGVYLPSPSSSCPGGGGTIGDLDGFRSVLRGAFLFFMSWGFVIRLSRSLPWVAGSDDLAPES
jgi:hypothetical protein